MSLRYDSDFYRVVDYHCQCDRCSVSDSEYNHKFSISFIRAGFFEYRTFRRNDEVHTGRILISKPHYEHTIRHIDNQPDITTIFEFNQEFYDRLKDQSVELIWFFDNPDIHSILVASNPTLEYLHQIIQNSTRRPGMLQLEMDEYVIRLVTLLTKTLSKKIATSINSVPSGILKHHLETAFKAKEFLISHFHENITLQQLASYCCVSVFHFSRIFKVFYTLSPHQFLMKLRMEHASHLLLHSQINITSIAIESGFNSLEHFVTSFKQCFGKSPGDFRIQVVEKQVF